MIVEPSMPGRWRYVLALAIGVIGLISFGVFLFRGLMELAPGIQVVVPGRHEFHLSVPGKYTVFHEHQSVVGGRVYSTGQGLDGLECGLSVADSGTPVQLSQSWMNTTYSLGSRSGESIWDFDVSEPGGYALDCRYAGNGSGSEAVLAIAHGTTQKLLRTVFGGLGILFTSLAAAGILAVLTWSKRQDTTRRHADPAI